MDPYTYFRVARKELLSVFFSVFVFRGKNMLYIRRGDTLKHLHAVFVRPCLPFRRLDVP